MLKFNSLSVDEQLMIISDETKTIINNLYLDVLDRSVDKNGLAGWGLLLENKLITEEEIKEKLYNSEEYFAREIIDTEQAIQEQYEKNVREIFALALDKEPTQEELEYYAKKLLDMDMTGDEIYEELISKNE